MVVSGHPVFHCFPSCFLFVCSIHTVLFNTVGYTFIFYFGILLSIHTVLFDTVGYTFVFYFGALYLCHTFVPYCCSIPYVLSILLFHSWYRLTDRSWKLFLGTFFRICKPCLPNATPTATLVSSSCSVFSFFSKHFCSI